MLSPRVGRSVSTGLPTSSLEKRPHNRHSSEPAGNGARHLARLPYLWSALYRSLLSMFSIAIMLCILTTPIVGAQGQAGAMNHQLCSEGRCDGGPSGSTNGSNHPSHGVDNGEPAPLPPACGAVCARIAQVYPDARTQQLLQPLARTPTGRDVLTYLLTMGERLGPDFIAWQDLHDSGIAGENNSGGYIQLNSGALARHDLGPYFLAGTLVHEAVESSFDIGAGLRNMGTSHADYVAQWFSGKFERELHALPYYNAQDPFYLPTDDSAYGLSYDAWLNHTEDGRLYQRSPQQTDLRQVDRKGRAWPPSDWWAEQGGFWLLGQGTDVTPVPNPLGLSPSLLAASDLRPLAS